MGDRELEWVIPQQDAVSVGVVGGIVVIEQTDFAENKTGRIEISPEHVPALIKALKELVAK